MCLCVVVAKLHKKRPLFSWLDLEITHKKQQHWLNRNIFVYKQNSSTNKQQKKGKNGITHDSNANGLYVCLLCTVCVYVCRWKSISWFPFLTILFVSPFGALSTSYYLYSLSIYVSLSFFSGNVCLTRQFSGSLLKVCIWPKRKKISFIVDKNIKVCIECWRFMCS